MEIYRILEEGYRNPDVKFLFLNCNRLKECEKIGLSKFPPMTNTMFGTDCPRISA